MNEIITPGEYEREITAVDSNALAIISRQEIDVQIATAHRFPRSITNFRTDAGSMATLNDSIASECSYALPRDGKLIEGPSVRFAEILLSGWGNCRAAARVVNDEGHFITAQGMFHDLQKNSAVIFEVRRRITNKHGKRFSDDMIVVAGNAAASIALRNAILKGIPKALWVDLWEQARKVAMGDHKTLANRRAEAMKLFQGYGVSGEQLFGFLSIRGVEEITTEHLLLLRGLATAFKDGDSTPEQVFGEPQGQRSASAGATKQPPQSIAERLDQFATADIQELHAPAGEPVAAAAEEPEAGLASPASEESAPSSHVTTQPPGAGDGTDSPAMEPKLADAYERGRSAKRGKYKRALPKNLQGQGREDEAAAFLRGWDDENIEQQAEQAGTV